ncbi:helix-turn-helix domain-containing protein [Streptomyces spectabilis]|uniref:DNA-binding protein n=1 Tax=Streptomyces spectabilis TaxID=68270 RepID=A0A5P2X856_STRST|nr:helix-turn-helix domain-containing protein [Streptomyces spectabilis]MBB5108343.1 excisionase family DNA binding protein [Streptomyces spectabilis]MCI3901100.1 helix-turn-helix domain-containing protein [Streptomyces spectabilis]QEV58592.1 DNA-binding protein [Streptomyces spectabilis]GGV45961.1 hypothetical protein GCM10010245_72050 [Streptomyces spectabilis]
MTSASAASVGGYLTTGEVAARIGSTPQHVRRLIESGHLAAINIARGALRPRFRISQSAIDDYLRSARVVPTEIPESVLEADLPAHEEVA